MNFPRRPRLLRSGSTRSRTSERVFRDRCAGRSSRAIKRRGLDKVSSQGRANCVQRGTDLIGWAPGDKFRCISRTDQLKTDSGWGVAVHAGILR